MAGFFALEEQKRTGLIGVAIGILLLLIITIIAACIPGGWTNMHRLVEDGRYIETLTGCGIVRGNVEGQDRFLFQSLPYSVRVDRFSHSRLASSLEECGDTVLDPSNSSTTCLRITQDGRVGEEDCLTLDIATSSVLYDSPMPVVVYLPGDDESLRPSTSLAHSQDVVWVTVSVRQGILGFLSHSILSGQGTPPISGNYGMGDLVTALQWVQLNIRHFGGDPEQVTILGHRQGASLALAVTAVEEAAGLYSRIWATGGAVELGTISLKEATEQWEPVVTEVCGGETRDCLVQVRAEELLGQVAAGAQYWAHDTLPSRGEKGMNGWLVQDTKVLQKAVVKTWEETPVTVPIVIGASSQVEANTVNFQFSNWNDTDQVEAIVEGSLGSFQGELPVLALAHYKLLDNWVEYISMVSDIRTVCPLEGLVTTMKETFSFPSVSFYLATERRAGQTGQDTGAVADSGMDVSAILGLLEDQNIRFQDNLQRKFLSFAKGLTKRMHQGITLFGEQITRVDSLDHCDFWRKTEDSIVPTFGKRF